MNANLELWQVQVQGWPSDLEHLARHFKATPFRVSKDERDGGSIYESDAFRACKTSEEVLKLATDELCVLSGVLKMTRDSPEPLRIGAVYRRSASGGRDVFVHIQETLHVRAEIGEVTVTVADAKGNVINTPVPPPRTVATAHCDFRGKRGAASEHVRGRVRRSPLPPQEKIVQEDRRLANAVTLLVGAAACTFSVPVYFPGFLPFDAAYQFWQVRTGEYNNLSPVPMTALWGAVHTAWPPPAAMLTLHFVAYWSGLAFIAILFWPRILPRVAFVLAAAASGLLLALPLAFAAPAAEFRYCGWMITASAIAALLARIGPTAVRDARPDRSNGA
jgi:hypothetical protein